MRSAFLWFTKYKVSGCQCNAQKVRLLIHSNDTKFQVKPPSLKKIHIYFGEIFYTLTRQFTLTVQNLQKFSFSERNEISEFIWSKK